MVSSNMVAYTELIAGRRKARPMKNYRYLCSGGVYPRPLKGKLNTLSNLQF
jgi:hypothetical protein